MKSYLENDRILALRSNISKAEAIDRLKGIVQNKEGATTVDESVLVMNPYLNKLFNNLGPYLTPSNKGLYYFRKGHPYIKPFNKISDAMWCGGFTKKLLADATVHIAEEIVENKVVLTLDHLEIVFIILLGGNFLGTVVFVVEKFVWKYFSHHA